MTATTPPTSIPIRAFFAVDLDAGSRAAVACVADALRASPGGDRVRWVRHESYHVTLRFLGEIDADRIESIVSCVSEQTAAIEPFSLELGGVQLFPSRRRPQFVVLDVGPVEPLSELAAAVERGAVAAGFGAEPRPFRAHLTLGRIRGRKTPVVTGVVTAAGETGAVTEAVLFRSELHRSGARYTPVARTSLGSQNPGSPLVTQTDRAMDRSISFRLPGG
jgi:2'-5' RNA ligase